MDDGKLVHTYVPEEEEKKTMQKNFNSRRNASGVSTITSFLLTIKNSARFLQRSQIVSRYVKNVLLLFLAKKKFISVIEHGIKTKWIFFTQIGVSDHVSNDASIDVLYASIAWADTGVSAKSEENYLCS